MGGNPSHYKMGKNHPVEVFSWNDCQGFIERLNEKKLGSYVFRLPTEAQWEYACRSGGKPEKYSGSNDVDLVACYLGNSGSQSHEVGTKLPNGLGLYDMSGNVWECCEDRLRDYVSNSEKNPAGPVGKPKRVIRGGDFRSGAWHVRCGRRDGILSAQATTVWAFASRGRPSHNGCRQKIGDLTLANVNYV